MPSLLSHRGGTRGGTARPESLSGNPGSIRKRVIRARMARRRRRPIVELSATTTTPPGGMRRPASRAGVLRQALVLLSEYATIGRERLTAVCRLVILVA
jgi:hypothetical protein